MLNIKPDIKSIIASIYECQKKLLYNRRILQEIDFEGSAEDVNKLIEEISLLEEKLQDMQKELRKRYEK